MWGSRVAQQRAGNLGVERPGSFAFLDCLFVGHAQVRDARALGLVDRIGTLEAGKQCDLAIWDVVRPAELVYRIGFNPLHARVRMGR